MDETTVIVAAATVVAAVLSASLTYYFSRRKEMLMESRRLKQQNYTSFMKALSDVAIDNEDEDAKDRLSEGFNTITLVGSAGVVAKLMDFHNFVSRDSSDEIDRDSPEWNSAHNRLLKQLVMELRLDLNGGDESSIRDFPEFHLTGRGGQRLNRKARRRR